MSHGLGRLHAPDVRDDRFLMRAVLPVAPLRLVRYWNDFGWWGNQGDFPHCVGYAWAAWVEDGPITHRGQPPLADPLALYHRAQQVDEWPGEGYEGTSVRAGAKTLQEWGFISEYRWAWDADTVVEAVLNVGPIVVGTNWYSGMWTPTHEDIIAPTGVLVGGHAYVINGANLKRGVVRIKNSYGRAWAGDGRAWMSIETLDRLLREDGEACLAVEVRETAHLASI